MILALPLSLMNWQFICGVDDITVPLVIGHWVRQFGLADLHKPGSWALLLGIRPVMESFRGDHSVRQIYEERRFILEVLNDVKATIGTSGLHQFCDHTYKRGCLLIFGKKGLRRRSLLKTTWRLMIHLDCISLFSIKCAPKIAWAGSWIMDTQLSKHASLLGQFN